MKFKFKITLLLLLFTVLSFAKITQTPLITQLQSTLETIYQENPKSVGIMVHVEAPDKNISWSSAVGVSNKDTQQPIEKDQPALIASNTKTYVAVALLQLIAQGKLQLNDSIKKHLSGQTLKLMKRAGYDTHAIKLVHLLSHTSGIEDYVNSFYLDYITKYPDKRWTHKEQIKLAMKIGSPLAEAGEIFSYADINYLLLTEIIQRKTHRKFYKAIKQLINYKKQSLHQTWFYSLERAPKNTKPLVHQYDGQLNWDSHLLDNSFDLYGGGGIAATTKDLALFFQNLFNLKVITDPKVLNLIHTTVQTKDAKDSHYRLGLTETEIGGYTAYGHHGFWATIVEYFPALNTTVTVFILENEEKQLQEEILKSFITILTQ
jgi:D-alanyl-D-alanine carboxypeptidase